MCNARSPWRRGASGVIEDPAIGLSIPNRRSRPPPRTGLRSRSRRGLGETNLRVETMPSGSRARRARGPARPSGRSVRHRFRRGCSLHSPSTSGVRRDSAPSSKGPSAPARGGRGRRRPGVVARQAAVRRRRRINDTPHHAPRGMAQEVKVQLDRAGRRSNVITGGCPVVPQGPREGVTVRHAGWAIRSRARPGVVVVWTGATPTSHTFRSRRGARARPRAWDHDRRPHQPQHGVWCGARSGSSLPTLGTGMALCGGHAGRSRVTVTAPSSFAPAAPCPSSWTTSANFRARRSSQVRRDRRRHTTPLWQMVEQAAADA